MNKKSKKPFPYGRVVSYTLLFVGAIIMLFPFYWMVISAFKTNDEIRRTIQTFFPENFVWTNFKVAMENKDFPFLRLMFNTIYVGVVSTIFTLITTILAAFAFARLDFKGKKLLLSVLLATMMVPGEMFIISNYFTVTRLGWLDTYTALIVPFVASVFYIYLLTNNFKQIPEELYLSAKVDGTSDFKYMYRVMVPIAMPTIISISILKMLGSWNSYIWPNLVTNLPEMRLVTNALRTAFIDAAGMTELNVQMAASLLVTLPILIIFVIFKKYIMKGSGGAGVKG